MTGTASDVLRVARGQLGYVEGPNNDTKFGRWFGLNHQPWCAMFVSWVAAESDTADIIPKNAYTPAGVAWFRDRGRYNRAPRVGSIVYYRWPNAGRVAHVGIVETVHSDGSITAIEGNTDAAGGRTGGQVMRQRRRRFIDGYGHPDYPAVAGVAPAQPAGQLVVDGELGSDTMTELQKALGVPPDGWVVQTGDFSYDFGPETTRALQTALNLTGAHVEVDGDLGPESITALQARLNHVQTHAGRPGITIDGQLGSQTIAALQESLLRGDLLRA